MSEPIELVHALSKRGEGEAADLIERLLDDNKVLSEEYAESCEAIGRRGDESITLAEQIGKLRDEVSQLRIDNARLRDEVFGYTQYTGYRP